MLNCAVGGEPAGFCNVISLTYWLAWTICWYPLLNYGADFCQLFANRELRFIVTVPYLPWNTNKNVWARTSTWRQKKIIKQGPFLNSTFLRRLFKIPLDKRLEWWIFGCYCAKRVVFKGTEILPRATTATDMTLWAWECCNLSTSRVPEGLQFFRIWISVNAYGMYLYFPNWDGATTKVDIIE